MNKHDNNILLEEMKNSYLKWFHKYCHFTMKWMGRPAYKTPFDAWVYQEIIFETKPSVVIEIGTHSGGSTLFLANILDAIGNGKVIGIDIDNSKTKDLNHDRITWITGNAVDSSVIDNVKQLISDNDKVMIIEDSSHEYTNTLDILKKYSPLVSNGCYFIVEDGICKENYIDGPKPGPFDAIHEFLKTHLEYQIDKKMEKFLLTYNPDGFLQKITNS
jgi:cephalosporin hydroxylase